MPKNLTDSSSWATVAVPVGTDPALASSVETPFQLLTNRTRFLINLIKSYIAACYLNLQKADTSNISTLDLGNVLSGCIIVDINGDSGHTIIDNDGRTAICKHPGESTPSVWGGGVLWYDETTSTPASALSWTAAGTRVDICGSWDEVVFARCAVSNSAAGQVGRSSTVGAWVNPVGSIHSSTIWNTCEYGSNQLWVIGGNSGAIATTPNLSTTAFTLRTSGLSNDVVRIRSNRKSGGDHRFLALDTNGDVSTSSYDGSTWTKTTPSGLTSYIKSIAWDTVGDRWVGIQYNGYRAWSVDNGATWTEGSTLPPSFNSDINNVFMLDCDDQGNLILNLHKPTNSRSKIWVSPNGGDGLDNGIIWQEAYHPDMNLYAKIAFMGHSKLISAGSSGILYSDTNFNTRWAGV